MTMTQPPSRYYEDLVRELCALPHETEWVELKENYRHPDLVGRYISALANSAALHDKPHGYVLWGVRNSTHEIVGTNFLPGDSKKGNELIEPWLARLLDPHVHFQFEETEVDGSRIVLLQVERATSQPVAFERTEFIRIGSSTRKLRGFLPDKGNSGRSSWLPRSKTASRPSISPTRILCRPSTTRRTSNYKSLIYNILLS